MGVEPTNFRTAATDDDKDKRLYLNGHNSLYYTVTIDFVTIVQLQLVLLQLYCCNWLRRNDTVTSLLCNSDAVTIGCITVIQVQLVV